MKAPQLVLIIFSIFLLLDDVALHGQSVVTPIVDKKSTEKTVEEGTKHFVKWGFLEKISDYTKIAREKFEIIEGIQDSVRQALLIANSITSLDWSDPEQLLGVASMSIGVPIHLDPSTAYAQLFQEMLDEPVPIGEKAENIYNSMYVPIASQNLEQVQDIKKQRTETLLAYSEYAVKKKMQVAVAYRQSAEDLFDKAKQMNASLTIRKEISLKEADRIRLQHEVDDYLVKAHELMEKSDNLINESFYQEGMYLELEGNKRKINLIVDALGDIALHNVD